MSDPVPHTIPLILVVVAVVGALINYVTTRDDLLASQIDTMQTDVNHLQDFQREVHYEVGSTGAQLEEFDKDMRHLDELDHVRDERIDRNGVLGAQNKERISKLEEIVDSIDYHGSRKWIERNGVKHDD